MLEGRLAEYDFATDHPADQSVPDHQQPLHEKAVGIEFGVSVFQTQLYFVVVVAQGETQVIRKQAVGANALAQHLAHIGRVDDQCAHQMKVADAAGMAAAAHKFVVEDFPAEPEQANKLVGGNPRFGLMQQLRVDTALPQQAVAVEAALCHAPDNGTSVVR